MQKAISAVVVLSGAMLASFASPAVAGCHYLQSKSCYAGYSPYCFMPGCGSSYGSWVCNPRPSYTVRVHHCCLLNKLRTCIAAHHACCRSYCGSASYGCGCSGYGGCSYGGCGGCGYGGCGSSAPCYPSCGGGCSGCDGGSSCTGCAAGNQGPAEGQETDEKVLYDGPVRDMSGRAKASLPPSPQIRQLEVSPGQRCKAGRVRRVCRRPEFLPLAIHGQCPGCV